MDNPDKTGNSGYIRRRKKQHTMRWTPSRANKHKKRKQDMSNLRYQV